MTAPMMPEALGSFSSSSSFAGTGARFPARSSVKRAPRAMPRATASSSLRCSSVRCSGSMLAAGRMNVRVRLFGFTKRGRLSAVLPGLRASGRPARVLPAMPVGIAATILPV